MASGSGEHGILNGEVLAAVAEMILSLHADTAKQMAEVYTVDDRLIFNAAMIGTVSGRPMNLSKIAAATFMSRATVRRRIARLLEHGVLVRGPGGTYLVAPEFANGAEVQARLATVVGLIARVNRAIGGGQNGH